MNQTNDATEIAADIDTAAFEHEVLSESARIPVIVDFWAPWCAPCRTLTPLLEREAHAAVASGKLRLVKVNLDANPELHRRYRIRGVPDVRVFKNGEEADSFTGVPATETLRAFVARWSGA
ncbi:thioredoxin family protein [Acidihalobacter prosperus]|uniref:Thioredoxin n=1 Tax=Acidihalobacter prosperus TaxID=160660 RepID=A0A1A6C202_9GAMM|nr:thioredoxin domain-containing protein [Acidihalobacter prosperus]OBS08596.1 thiol reductase thioredoxin [Acidihalobacter prosperus]